MGLVAVAVAMGLAGSGVPVEPHQRTIRDFRIVQPFGDIALEATVPRPWAETPEYPDSAPYEPPAASYGLLAQLTAEQVDAVYAAAGVPEAWVEPLRTIAWCESKYSPGAVGDSGNSLGMHQLWTGWFREGEDPFDPVTNTRVSLRIRETRGRFGGGGGWTCATLNGIP